MRLLRMVQIWNCVISVIFLINLNKKRIHYSIFAYEMQFTNCFLHTKCFLIIMQKKEAIRIFANQLLVKKNLLSVTCNIFPK